MAGLGCPIPEVEEALAPYIHSRQETRQIRASIAQHLDSAVKPGPSDGLLLSCLSTNGHVNEESSGLDGIYKRYHDALRANIAARESYARVKQELEEMSSEALAQQPGHNSRSVEYTSIQDYINSKRQRQQHTKLGIIQDTLSKLTDEAPRPLHEDLGAIIREEVGEAPAAPKSSFDAVNGTSPVEELTFKLKRELLLAKTEVDEATRVNEELQENLKSMPEPTPEAQIQALVYARDHLIAWIEGELAKISEGEGDSSILDAESRGPQPDDSNAVPEEAESLQQINELYDKYVEARRKLVHTIDGAVQATKYQASTSATVSENTTTARENAHSGSEPVKYTDLLTCAPSLVQAARIERALVQQSSYFRRRLVSATEEVQAIIQRLAGESYLVTSNSTEIGAWSTAAAAKSKETDTFVVGQLRTAQASMQATQENLARAEARVRALEQLKGSL